jgi:hypothetical protein
MGSGARGVHFSPRRRTAVVLSGEGTGAAYLVGVMRALDAAGVRIDVVLGRGAGALVAAFSGLGAEDKIDAEGGLLDAAARVSPFRVAPFYRFAGLCLSTSFACFAAPALLGLVSVVVLPIQSLVRGIAPAAAAGNPGWLSDLVSAVEPYYLPAVALPVIVLFLAFTARCLRLLWRARGRRPGLSDLFPPPFDLDPLERILSSRLWQLSRGTASEERPRDRRALSEAYVQLLGSGLGQQGFREIVLYALDTDTGEEVPFVALKERFAKKMAADPPPGRREPIDLSGEGASVLFDALIAALTPPGLAPEVGIRLPRGTKLGGEVHRFASSLSTGGAAIPDAVATGAEQIFYVTSAAAGSRVSGSLWERVSIGALRASLERDLLWAAESTDVPVFVVRPESERLAPYELQGRPQPGGGRLSPSALVDQGARDVERLFVRPVLGEELSPLPREATMPVDREWEAGPKEL